MLGVLQGFALILGIIGAGYLAARFRVVEGEQRRVLNNVAFYVATPALLFSVLSRSDPSVILSPVILITSAAALIVAAAFIVASRLWFRRDLAGTTLGATCAGYVNSNNLGLPVALYILGDAAYVAPLLLVQLVVFAPAILAILETTRGNQRGAVVALGRAAANPVILGSVAGFLVALLALPVPELLLAPVDMLGGAAIPMVLLSFGMSLRGQRALQRGTGRAAVFVATGLKIFAMPLVAWLLALAFGLPSHEVFVATTIAALPTAQNVYNYAATYRRAETMVRDTVFLTTFTSLPVIALISVLLGQT
ncbi:AEC family transporter [Leucobacter chromiireducens]|uniref:AEC family transporter n=1 Tax=Leucobacter chromiireducens subsp. solipictus TaxID=398235 RepID=A0ABS1SCZ1_9MICO|nr:AEC family transporter [Leucobacter chromiireducens]MBL3678417.1 AEC family transporter [Leucobacter chromiireducens subsp. solipictus]